MLHIILHVQRSLKANTYNYSINQCYSYLAQKSDVTKAKENWREEERGEKKMERRKYSWRRSHFCHLPLQ